LPVDIKFASGPFGNALVDLDGALRLAERAGDAKAVAHLRRLLRVYFWETLRAKSYPQLEAFLATLQVWRTEGEASVFKTVDEPCMAFTALAFDEGLYVVVLGACYRYPNSQDAWWRDVIRPRLRVYL
jgi:hypothetical protein